MDIKIYRICKRCAKGVNAIKINHFYGKVFYCK